MAAEVLLDKHAGVATLTLNRPAQRNALTPAMADEMVAALSEIEADAAIGAAVIRGAGGHFCAGADLGEAARMFADPLEPAVHEGTSRIYEAFVRAGHLAVPVVAAVRGAAVGAGMNLLLAADLRVVSNQARLLSGFLRLGVHPGGGHMLLLAEAAGAQAAAAMAVFGEEIDGSTAQALGLAWAALPDEEVEPHAQAAHDGQRQAHRLGAGAAGRARGAVVVDAPGRPAPGRAAHPARGLRGTRCRLPNCPTRARWPACACSTSPRPCPAPSAPRCWPTWAPTCSRSSLRAAT
jgi:enoyl-CoA hydratase